MATTYTLSGGLLDADVPFTGGKVQGWLALANAETLIEAATGEMHLGRWKVDVDSLGAIAEPLPSTASGAGWLPDGGFLWQLYLEYRDSAPKAVRKVFVSQPFSMTEDRTLAEAIGDGLTLTSVSAADWADFQAKYEEMAAVVATNDGITATNITTPASLTAVALSATLGTEIETENTPANVASKALIGTEVEASPLATRQELDAQGVRARAARDGAYRIAATEGLAAFLSVSGLAFTSSYYAASVGGTDGTGIWPNHGTDSRAGFRVKCTKATASSQSYVGVCNTATNTAPTGVTPTFGVGYKAGVGLCIIRENIGADIVLVADAAITDGDEYDVGLILDRAFRGSSTSNGYAKLLVRYAKADGTGAGISVADINLANWPLLGNWFLRTDVAAGGITNLTASAPVTGTGNSALCGGETQYSAVVGEDVVIRIPKNPNGLGVIACHGHGGTAQQLGWTPGAAQAAWERLEAAGYTLFIPDLGGNLWGNNVAQSLIATIHELGVEYFKLDPRFLLWGDSMGGGAALTAIGKHTIPVRAAFVSEPVCNLSLLWANPSFASLPAAYANDTALRDANSPILIPAAEYADVPILFVASPDDTTVVKTTNTDAMRTHLGSVTEHKLVTVSGIHASAGHYPALDPLAWFASHL